MVKSSIFPAGIMSCLGVRHLETQTNHLYVWGLHYQSEII